ncbi:SufD family Fe-S cluster assembly protein [Infirmifilum lucidum]|uniref:SufD family Fe-S cluster assembly protein n=1 Tax=Infirmifilum lucidum TaxID=2776706 RepID=A0A7L9FJ10_9CREN|nr:SufD family Fe-S cluster assembly protein [Infirmifilum lucidum]QOJ78886.1 SufD family Fe-S cluster assembly protein [Infirmifilum lucidum]
MRLEEVLRTPYQPLADSPSTRYYTDWRAFNSYFEKPSPPLGLSWDEDLLATLGLKPTVILKPTEVAEKPLLDRAGLMRVLGFHVYNLNSLEKILVTDTRVNVLVPKPSEGTLSAHLSIRARGAPEINVLLLSPETAGGLTTLTIDLQVEPGSSTRLNYIIFDSMESPTAVFQEATLADGAELETIIAIGRSKTLHLETRSMLTGSKSKSYTRALLAANRGSKITLVTDAVAQAPGTELEIQAVGFARNGYIAHKGYARSRRGARGSKLRVASRLVPLSSQAKVYASPVLEIESDEPSEAGHSVAQSPLDPDQAFYLQARGFRPEEAEELLVRGAYNSLVNFKPGRAEFKSVIDLLMRELNRV